MEHKYQDYRGGLNSLGQGLDDLSIQRNLFGSSLNYKDSIEGKMILLVEELVDLLNKEYRQIPQENQTEERPKVELMPRVPKEDHPPVNLDVKT